MTNLVRTRSKSSDIKEGWASLQNSKNARNFWQNLEEKGETEKRESQRQMLIKTSKTKGVLSPKQSNVNLNEKQNDHTNENKDLEKQHGVNDFHKQDELPNINIEDGNRNEEKTTQKKEYFGESQRATSNVNLQVSEMASPSIPLSLSQPLIPVTGSAASVVPPSRPARPPPQEKPITRHKKENSLVPSMLKLENLDIHPSQELLQVEPIDVPTEELFNKKLNHESVTMDFSVFNTIRDRCAYEILTSEETYIKSLQIAIILYRNPIDKALKKGSLSDKIDYKCILKLFYVMCELINVNLVFLNSLRERFKNWSNSQVIGAVFLAVTPFLKLYSEYPTAYESARKVLEFAETKDKFFESIVKNGVAHPLSKNCSLSSFLILPIQRTPRYVLLLQTLIKETKPDHPDYEFLQKSLEEIQKTAKIVNEAIPRLENLNKCYEIQRLLHDPPLFPGPEIVKPFRLYVHNVSAFKQCRKKRKRRELWLFNDILILTTEEQPNGKYHFKSMIPLDQIIIEDNPPVDNEIGFIIKAPGKSVCIYCTNPQDKVKWVNLLKNQTKQEEKNEQENQVAPVWTPDDEVMKCRICSVKFNIFIRKHHCRNCGQIVCGECSKKNAIVPAVSPTNLVRVCDTCYQKLKKRLSN